MALRKCPHCETNYIRGNETICSICAAELKRRHDRDDEPTLCIECGEQPAEEGSELCLACLEEQHRQQQLELMADKIRAEELGAELIEEPEEEE